MIEEQRETGTGKQLTQQDAPKDATGDSIPKDATDSIPGNSNLTNQQAYTYRPLDRPIRVACAGDSLTLGRIGTNPGEDYPSILQNMLGDAFETHNYGVNSVTAIRGLNASYNKTQAFQNSIGLDADIYLLMLGTNDAKYWSQHSHKFATDMKSTIQEATATRTISASRMLLAIPPWVKMDYGEIKNDILLNHVQPTIQEVASAQQIQLVDMYAVTFNRFDFYTGDNLHLNAKGYIELSQAWQKAILCNYNGVCETGESCETCPRDCRLNCI
ncbi:unnamed protein product [Cylindrotheca closterium]|uniref:SGNH hydrolase-type esterase domain-containing protein n=1 Tax=Cylindrotheca closterium TaxID=2856 RepID=A0AAD2G9U1_9STRA|nr:unnamed protein product [Cylindrotheca closterium]